MFAEEKTVQIHRFARGDKMAAGPCGKLFFPETHYGGVVEVFFGFAFYVVVDFAGSGGGGK